MRVRNYFSGRELKLFLVKYPSHKVIEWLMRRGWKRFNGDAIVSPRHAPA